MKDMKTVVELALEIAEELPEKYQTVAFEQILSHELAGAPASQVDTATEDKQVSSVAATTPSWEERLIGNLPEDHIIAKHGTRDQQTVWAVIALQDRGEEATTGSVRNAIKKDIGISPQDGHNTSHTLRGLSPKHLRREARTEGRGYAYYPTANALEVFEGLGQ